MLNLTCVVVGVGLVTIEILIQHINDGKCSTFTSWLAGVYIGIGTLNLLDNEVLCTVLCVIPSVTILVSHIVRRCTGNVRV